MVSKKKKVINFLDSYQADTSVVPEIINHLINSLKELDYHVDEIDEIVLSMDEAITNAVQETIRKQECLPRSDYEKRRAITIRYMIDDEGFDATIIDHGKGLNVNSLKGLIPDSKSKDYHSQIIRYASDAERKKLKVRLNGKEITLKGIGAGLKIILAFMDSVTIDLIDKEKVLSTSVTDFTDGTILNLKRTRRYH